MKLKVRPKRILEGGSESYSKLNTGGLGVDPKWNPKGNPNDIEK